MLQKLIAKYTKNISPKVVLIFFTIVGALIVRLYGLGQYDFSEDELWHLTVSNQENLFEVIKYNFEQEIHPPLSYIIWHLALQISHNELWLRMPTIIAGIFLIPASYVFGRLYIGKAGGYGLAFIFAFASMPAVISTSIRAYSFLMLALMWAAIFVHKYCYVEDVKSKRKYLLYYFICCVLALELHHASCFVIFSLALVLLFFAVYNKDKKDFVIISLIHFILMILLLGYRYILSTYFGFEGIPGYFLNGNFLDYVMRYLNTVLLFIDGLGEDNFGVFIVLFSFLACLITPILLIRDKKWILLNILFVPVLIVMLCNYWGIYPLSETTRNNLFLVLSISITYGYFIQKFCDVVNRRIGGLLPEIVKFFSISFAPVLLIGVTTIYFVKTNSSRNLFDRCKEFTISNKDNQMLDEQIKKRDKEDNIFVTVPRSLWKWRFKSGDKDHVTILDRNLAKFENEEILIYFDADPPITKSVMEDMLDYKIFFTQLFKYLEEKGELSKVKTITFFDLGLKVEYLAYVFHPQFYLKEVDKNDTDLRKCQKSIFNEFDKEKYNVSWAINSSPEILSRFYSRDINVACGREIYVLEFSPKFVYDEIISKDFLDLRELEQLEKKQCRK